eukprot:8483251-Lingulodinium_polyedra.AAC.1
MQSRKIKVVTVMAFGVPGAVRDIYSSQSGGPVPLRFEVFCARPLPWPAAAAHRVPQLQGTWALPRKL